MGAHWASPRMTHLGTIVPLSGVVMRLPSWDEAIGPVATWCLPKPRQMGKTFGDSCWHGCREEMVVLPAYNAPRVSVCALGDQDWATPRAGRHVMELARATRIDSR